MRYLVLSDIHANMPALEAVLADAAGWERLLVLGDLVGYGAEPNEVVERIRALAPYGIIRGNHDRVGAGLEPANSFNTVARRAIAWTRDRLTAANREFLASLPQGPLRIEAGLEICHGAPFDEDEYLFSDLEVELALRATTEAVCLFGHTHVPACYRLEGGRFESLGIGGDTPEVIRWDPAGRTLVNCGSVGQPRDGDARAAYGIVDTTAREVQCLRAAYDIEQAQARITAAGLPEMLARRLALGR